MPYERLVRDTCDLVDAVEPQLRALVPEPGRRHRLLVEAERLDPARRPLLVGVKDIVNVSGLPTRAGTVLPPELFAGPEASAVSRLRASGALVLGKTTTTELAFCEPSPTTNPHDQRHTPGGSSSGSAAAVAAGYVPLAIGTQTVDSIVSPAAYCGVVGFKPSYGRSPADGIVPFAPAVDHVGLLARDLATTELGAAILCENWSRAELPGLPTIGLADSSHLDMLEPPARAAFEAALYEWTGAGCQTVQTTALADIGEVYRRHRRLVAAQFARIHGPLFDHHADRLRPRTRALFAEGAALGPSAEEEGIVAAERLRQELAQTMSERGIDIWLSPATPGPAPDGLDYIGDPIMAAAWTSAHLPVLCLPAGKAPGGLPVAVQLVGRPGADEQLLGWARVLQQHGFSR